MDTKRNTQLPILEKCPPIFTSTENRGFIGAYPPTGEQILLQYHGYHKYLQEITKRQSSSKDALNLVIKDIEDWWKKTGIPLKTRQRIEVMVEDIIEKFRLRKRLIQRSSPKEVERRKEFLESLKYTFWVVQPDYENKLKDQYIKGNSNQRQSEDWLYLEGVRGMNRKGILGSLDTNLEKRKKRAFSDKQAFEARKLKASTSVNIQAELPIDDDFDEESDDDCSSMYEAPVPTPKRKCKKKEIFKETTYLVADKDGISNRVLTQLAATIKQADGEDLDDYNLSVKTIERRRKSIRTTTARDILRNQFGDSSDKRFALHWDGKIIKSLTHTGNDIEHVAVILTGTDGQEVLLSIIGIEGPSTADNEAQHIIKVCVIFRLTFYFYNIFVFYNLITFTILLITIPILFLFYKILYFDTLYICLCF